MWSRNYLTCIHVPQYSTFPRYGPVDTFVLLSKPTANVGFSLVEVQSISLDFEFQYAVPYAVHGKKQTHGIQNGIRKFEV